MKEKETVTCPICGGTLQVQGQALFKEHHKRLWEKKVKELGIGPIEDYESCFGRSFYYDRYSSHYTAKEKPIELIKWEVENPAPEMDMINFIVNVTKQFFHSELQKGGLQ